MDMGCHWKDGPGTRQYSPVFFRRSWQPRIVFWKHSQLLGEMKPPFFQESLLADSVPLQVLRG